MLSKPRGPGSVYTSQQMNLAASLSHKLTLCLCMLVLSGCVPATAFPPPVPTPAKDWRIELSQTGGFAGVDLSIQVTSDGKMTASDERAHRTVSRPLSEAKIDELHKLVARVAPTPTQTPPSVCADCFIYRLEITSSSGTVIVRADDISLGQSPARALIELLGQIRDEALQSGT
jgi:hypothetical protein